MIGVAEVFVRGRIGEKDVGQHDVVAAAMSTLILLTSASASLLLATASRGLLRRSQAWRQRAATA